MDLLTVSYQWIEIGTLALDAEKLRFPQVPEEPGIYRFAMSGIAGDTSYIGEADRLRRRFQHYRTPGSGQPTNLRLNRLLTDLLSAGRTATVSIITTAEVEIDGRCLPLDLRTKPARLLIENAALVRCAVAGQKVENL